MRKIPDSYIIHTFDGEQIPVDLSMHAHIERMIAQGQKFFMLNGEGYNTGTFKRIQFVPGREIMEAGDFVQQQLEAPKKTEKQLRSEYRAYCDNLDDFEVQLLAGKIGGIQTEIARSRYHSQIFKPKVNFDAFVEEDEKAQVEKRTSRYLTEFWFR
jgi:hypothetical protein